MSPWLYEVHIVKSGGAATDGLSPEKRALFALLLGREGLHGDGLERVPRRTLRGPAPLSFAQQRLWLAEQLVPGSAAYNVAAVLRLDGVFRVDALEHAFSQLIRRHEVLRTRFVTVGGEPMQVVDPLLDLPLTRIDLRESPARDREEAVRHLSRDEAQRPFDLERAPLMRATLLQLDAASHVLLLTMHHIVSDGWSVGVLARELSGAYESAVAGVAPSMPALPIQYADYAVWQRERVKDGALDRGIAYWKERLAGASGLLELPSDRPRRPQRTLAGALHRIAYPPDLTEALTAFSRREGVTLFMTLLAGFMVLLHRYSGQDDILVGSPVADRPRPELEPLIGFFTNTVALRGTFGDDPAFRAFVSRIRDVCLGAFEHQHVPFDRVVEAVQPERATIAAPLVQTLFVLQNAPRPVIDLGDLSLRIDDGETGAAPFELTLSLQQADGRLVGSFEYSTELFDAETIARMTVHLETLLRAASTNPTERVSELALMPQTEREDLLTWGTGLRAPVTAGSIPELVARQARLTPDALALQSCAVSASGRSEHLTYARLVDRAHQVSKALRALGVGPESPVGVCLRRSAAWPVAILGVLESGGACVLLDPSMPSGRLRDLLKIARADVVLVESVSARHFTGAGCRVLDVEEPLPQLLTEEADRFGCGAPGQSLAFVIFTSGSTGSPKAVMIPHDAVVNHCLAMTAACELTSADRVLQFSSLGFDVALEELFPAWACGAAVVLRPWQETPLISELAELVRREGITVVNVPSSYWHTWADDLYSGRSSLPDTVRLVIAGSERTLAERLRQWQHALPRPVQWRNAYGATEATITSTLFDPSHARLEPGSVVVPAGRPIANTEAFVLDRRMHPVPPGVVGELYIGGEGVSRGYLGDPAGTAERFLPHPFSGRAGARLYRTGDRARWRNGQLEIRDRVDRQVKVRGFRIEPAEIEAVLARHRAVRHCAVVGHDDGSGNVRLMAHVVTDEAAGEADALRDFLAEHLPAFMIPSGIVLHAELPVTAGGKVDYRALSSAAVTPSRGAYQPPRSHTESAVAGIWSDVLGLERVGVHDNFFALGGHSLLAIQVMSRLRSTLHLDVPLHCLFEHPTVAGLASVIDLDAIPKGRDAGVVSASTGGSVPLSAGQEHVWWMEQVIPGSPLFNMPCALQISGELDVPAFYRSLDEVIRRHESLRTSFTRESSGPVQRVVAPDALERVLFDATNLEEGEQQREVEQRAREAAFRPFDLTAPPLLRAALVRLAAREHVALMTVHHIAADGWSVDLLARELGVIYDAVSRGVASPLPELRVQYKDYALWQRARSDSEEHRSALAYWARQLASCRPQPLPADKPRPAQPTFETAVVQIELGGDLTNGVQQLSRSLGSTSFMVLLAAFELLLFRRTGFEDLRVATLAANRQRTEFEDLIGLFANTIVLRTNLSGDPTFRDLVARVRAAAVEGYARQEVPLESIVRELEADPAFDQAALVNIEFQWETQDRPVTIPGLAIRPLRWESRPDLGISLTTCDLVVSLTERSEGIIGSITYKTGLFDAETVNRLGIDFSDVLTTVVRQSERKLSELVRTTGQRETRP